MATIAICLTRTKGAPCTACLRSSEPYLCMAQCPLRCCRRKYVCTEDPKELAWLMGVEEKELKSAQKKLRDARLREAQAEEKEKSEAAKSRCAPLPFFSFCHGLQTERNCAFSFPPHLVA